MRVNEQIIVKYQITWGRVGMNRLFRLTPPERVKLTAEVDEIKKLGYYKAKYFSPNRKANVTILMVKYPHYSSAYSVRKMLSEITVSKQYKKVGSENVIWAMRANSYY